LGMEGDLAVDRMGEQARAGRRVVHGHAGFVAGGFDAKDTHGGTSGGRVGGPRGGGSRVGLHSAGGGGYHTRLTGRDPVFCVPEIPCPASKSARTSPSSLRCVASSAPARRPVSWPKPASASTTRSRPRSASARPLPR